MERRGYFAFEWVHERDESGLTPREQLREVYRDASGRLATLYARDGRNGEAAQLYQELLRSDPLDGAIVRALMTCYARAGDRTGLVRTEKALRQALNAERAEDEDPWEPEPETVDLFEHLVADLEARDTRAHARETRTTLPTV